MDAAHESTATPAELLELAWSLEVGLRLTERTEVLDRLETCVTRAAPPGRDWELELLAERAIDAARLKDVGKATELALRVLDTHRDDAPVASARATEAWGRALAWTGTDGATRRAEHVLTEAAARYRELGHPEWAGYAIFARANTVHLQHGELSTAARLMAEALAVMPAHSPRRATVLSFQADVLIALGDWPGTEAVLGEADSLAAQLRDPMSSAYVAWARARMASARGDAMATERYVREAERESADWFSIHTGTTFLADAAELLDRVGLRTQAEGYLTRAQAREPQDSFVQQARAALLARTGHPGEALDALQELTRGSWLEKRMVWRLTLLTAWATFRAGREGAGELAARALELAASSGGPRVATAAEPDLTAALLPLAEAAGSTHARELLAADENRILVRLFGAAQFTDATGRTITPPPGQPAELLRMLAVHPAGVTVDTVLEWFFPDIPAERARQRLRQILLRLRTAGTDLVVRTADSLRLVPAWVDVGEFISAVDRIRGARGSRAVQLAYTALALRGGPVLPADVGADWSAEIRNQVEYRYLSVLDLIAEDAAARGSHQEALTALTSALEENISDPDERHGAAAKHFRALGRGRAADYLDGLGRS